MSRPAAVEEDLRPEWHALLDQELTGLPEKSGAIVSVRPGGQTRREAARLLGCPRARCRAGCRGRGRCSARRLAKHGLGLSAGAVAAALVQGTAPAGVPAPLAASTVKAAALVAAGQAAAGAIPAQVVALSEGVLKAMLLTKLRTVTAVVLALGLLGLGAARACTRRGRENRPPRPNRRPHRRSSRSRPQAGGGACAIGPLPQTAYVSLIGDRRHPRDLGNNHVRASLLQGRGRAQYHLLLSESAPSPAQVFRVLPSRSLTPEAARSRPKN